MNGILSAHRVLDGKTQLAIGSINNAVIAKVRNSILKFMNEYLGNVKPSTVAGTVNFTEDSEIVTPSSGTGHSEVDPVRVYFHVTVSDSIEEFAEEYMLYADVAFTTPASPAAYSEMNTAFKDAQYKKTGLTKHELNGTGVFVDTMIFKL